MTHDAPTWGDLAAEHVPRTDQVTVCMAGDLVAEINRLEAQLPALQRSDDLSNDPDQAPDTARRILALRDEAATHNRTLEFTAIGTRAWDDLMAAHPPTDDQKADRPGIDHNPDTFPYEAVARSCTNVSGTAAQVADLAGRLTPGDWAAIWNTCLAVNLGGTQLPKCAGATGILQPSGESSTTAPPEGSTRSSARTPGAPPWP